ncbi:MAG: VOC family protein [Myxococcota bacterium]|jgi:catechol 2,3-dioxygenase-like lactoylglutathione lyase family enzyme|nr:VOC family protein [Myxococcota bacterium]
MIEVRGLDHVVLRTIDTAAVRRFYGDVLGCTVERESEALGLIQLRAGTALIDLMPVAGPLGKLGGAPPATEGRNVDHFCLRLESFDEANLRGHLEKHGVEPGDVATRYGAEGNGPSMYIEDPDGNVVELKGPPDPA